MSWFKKKKIKESPKPSIAPCNHKWKDFPWYYEATYDSYMKRVIIDIIEPYVCIHCKQRKNIELNTIMKCDITYKESEEITDEIIKRYEGKLMDKAIVEDMIHDMQLVDREYLAIIELLKRPVLKIK